MTTFQKGEYVVATERFIARSVQRGYTLTVNVGDEFMVTVDDGGSIFNARQMTGAAQRVYKLPRGKVKRQTRRLGEVPEGGIDPSDPRIAWFFEDAALLANRMGLCNVYDRMMEELNAPGRLREYKVKLDLGNGVVINGTFEARRRSEAEDMLLEKLRGQPTELPRPKAISA